MGVLNDRRIRSGGEDVTYGLSRESGDNRRCGRPTMTVRSNHTPPITVGVNFQS
jgi:hypothetical protein